MVGKKYRRYSKCCRSDFERIRLRCHPPEKLCANKNQICHTTTKTQFFPWGMGCVVPKCQDVVVELRSRETFPSLSEWRVIDSPLYGSVTALPVALTFTLALLQMGESMRVLNVFLCKGTLRTIRDWKVHRVGIVAGLYKIIINPLLNLSRRN